MYLEAQTVQTNEVFAVACKRSLFHNYADLLPAAVSGHVLTDIPKLLNDAQWEFFSSCSFSHYLSLFLSSQSYANTLKHLSGLCCESFFSGNLSTIGSFIIMNVLCFSSQLNKNLFSHSSVFGCKASNILNAEQNNCRHVVWCFISQDCYLPTSSFSYFFFVAHVFVQNEKYGQMHAFLFHSQKQRSV